MHLSNNVLKALNKSVTTQRRMELKGKPNVLLNVIREHLANMLGGRGAGKVHCVDISNDTVELMMF